MYTAYTKILDTTDIMKQKISERQKCVKIYHVQ